MMARDTPLAGGMPEMIPDFLALSAALTGFAPYELRATGQTELYLATACEMAGEGAVAAMLADFTACKVTEDGMHRHLRLCILSHSVHGPIARTLIKLWYVGTWHALPQDWHEANGGAADDRDHVPSPSSYTEGLLWPAIGANPPGAKPFGYGMWAHPPRVSLH